MVSSDPIILPTCLLEIKEDLPIVRLPHPRSRLPALFAIRDGQGIWEIQSVVSPPTSTRSWFFEPSREDQPDQVLSLQDGRLLFATAFDPFFLLLGLFFGHDASERIHNPFEQSLKKSNKNDHPNSRFEEIDSIVEKVQEHWVFAGSGDRPTTGDVELFLSEALRHQNLSRIFAPLEQDSGPTLWRVEPERVIAELKRKINQLTKAGLEAGRETNTIWARLASRETLSLNSNETSDASFLLNEVYKKISLNMIQAYLPSVVSEQLTSLSEFEFKALEEELKKNDQLSAINPLEIGRKDDKKTSTSSTGKSLKLPPTKKSKKNEPPPLNSGSRTLDSFFKKPDASSSKK